MSIDTAVGAGAVDPEAVRDELRRMPRAGQVLTDAASLDAYAHDDAEWAPFEPPVGLLKLPGARAKLGERSSTCMWRSSGRSTRSAR